MLKKVKAFSPTCFVKEPVVKAITLETTFDVKVQHDSDRVGFACRADQTVLEAADVAGVTLPSSCGVGMCTSCAAQLTEGNVELGEGSVCGAECQETGFVLLCLIYPRSDLQLIAGQEERLYSLGGPFGTSN